jgi:hypothetical protein
VALVVLALGIIGVRGTVGSASPNNANDHNDKEHTLTVLTKNREARVVDLSPQGVSQGDMRVVNAPLYNESGTRKIGRFDQFCVLTDPADKPDEKDEMTECVYTYTLPDGEISAEGLSTHPSLFKHPVRNADALSGGTEKYAGVRGEVRFVARANKVISTFHFID